MNDPFLPEGSLYRLDPDGSFTELDSGYATANGIGFSLDSRTVYVADQRNWQIIAMDYNPVHGTTSNRRVFATLPKEEGQPDGLIVDSEGYIWNGHQGGWKLTRYDPDGKIERQIPSRFDTSSPLPLAVKILIYCTLPLVHGILPTKTVKRNPGRAIYYPFRQASKG